MIKLVSGDTLILGILKENVEKLQEGKPLLIRAKVGDFRYALTAGIERIVIYYGETAEALVDELVPHFPEIAHNREQFIKELKTPRPYRSSASSSSSI